MADGLRLNRYIHPYWPLVLSNVAIPLEKLPSSGVEASCAWFLVTVGNDRTAVFPNVALRCEEYTVVLGVNLSTIDLFPVVSQCKVMMKSTHSEQERGMGQNDRKKLYKKGIDMAKMQWQQTTVM